MALAARRIDFGVTTLGSGGPNANAHRGSAGYCVWIGGRPRLILDAGGGSFSRLGMLEIPVAEIDTIAFTHTHIDHTGGIRRSCSGRLYSNARSRSRSSGPTGHARAPGAARFIDLLFGREGAWSYLYGFDDFAYRVFEASSEVHPSDGIVEIPIGDPDYLLRAVAVRHGTMPALAFRVEYGGRVLVYSGDVAEESDSLVDLALGCDLLIHDFALPERHVANDHLHAKPSAVGRGRRSRALQAAHGVAHHARSRRRTRGLDRARARGVRGRDHRSA